MVLATISSTSLSTLPLTVISFLTSLKAAIAAATVTTASAPYLVTTTVFDDMTSSGYVVYQVTTDSTKTKGTAYWRVNASIASSTLTVTQSLSDTWNATTHAVTGAAAGTGSTFTTTLNTNNPVTFTVVKHPEMQLVLIDQGTSPLNVVGWVRPFYKITEWDENTCPFLFIPFTETLQTFYGVSSTLFPFTSATGVITLLPHTQYQKVNKISGLPPIKPGPLELLPSSNEGGCGSFSSDIAVGGCNTISRINNTVTAGGKTYTIVVSNAAAASILIQTA